MIETTVESVDLRSPPPIAPETPVTEAARTLRRPPVSALPVLEDESVVGIVTESDIVALVAETAERPATRVIMSSPVTTVSPTATIADAAETMRTNGVKHLPVVSDGVYRGLLSVHTLAPYLPRHRLTIEWQDEPMRLGATEGQTLTVVD
ncbi:cyclic nucleotide-binding/CBS domain-containing protein [Natrinema pallidum]|uniref:CBS domain-containing protein n=1 Tax=Natrinema pallidum TaxID=69527 RepID=A0A4P9TE00_9EURY|nr:CBS domain-containing protein [Natrinema pallidum]QCW02991.1 CBS domain-containing protein [Natrinema pallidum]